MQKLEAANARVQASVCPLYDSTRWQGPTFNGSLLRGVIWMLPVKSKLGSLKN